MFSRKYKNFKKLFFHYKKKSKRKWRYMLQLMFGPSHYPNNSQFQENFK